MLLLYVHLLDVNFNISGWMSLRTDLLQKQCAWISYWHIWKLMCREPQIPRTCGVFQAHTCPSLFTIRLLLLFALNHIPHYRKDTNSNIWSKSPCEIIHQRGTESFTKEISVTVWMEFFSSCNVWYWLPFSDFFFKKTPSLN